MFVDPTKLASAITEVVQSIFVNEEEVNKAYSLSSKRQSAKVEVTFMLKPLLSRVLRFYQAKFVRD